MDTLWQDVRYAFRMLVKKPGFTVLAVTALALGIGANSTIFSFVNAILIRPVPFKEPDRLVVLDETSLKRPGRSWGVSYPNFTDWREQNTLFEGMAAYGGGSYTLTGSGEPERFYGVGVSHGLFETIGVEPLLGRTITAEEDRPKHDPVVLLGYGLWERRFNADPGIIGQTLQFNGRDRTVIGVMPQGFKFPDVADLWVPLALDSTLWTRNDHGLAAIGRLKPGVTLQQAQTELDVIAERIEQAHPVTNEGMRVRAIDLREGFAGDYRQALIILLAVVGLVLLIACANVANLLLARASAREKEIAIRIAIGARRGRIVRQLLTESLILGALGGLAGLVLSIWGMDLLLAAIPIDIPYWMKFEMDARVLGFTTAISLLTALVFGLIPALQISRPNLNESLKEGGRSATVGGGRNRFRGALVVAEVTLSLVLLIGAGLMIKSFLRLQNVNPGLRPENVLTLSLSLPQARYKEPEKRSAFYRELLQRVEALPGVESVGATTNLPLGGSSWGRSLTVEGRPVLSVGEAPMVNHAIATPNYFKAMGIPLLRGRDFTEADAKGAVLVTIVNETLAREFFPEEEPLGKRIRFGPPEDNEPWHTIVGVVGDVRHHGLNLDYRRSAYIPHPQNPVGFMSLAVRSAAAQPGLAAALREQVRQMDPDLPLGNMRMMEEVIARSVWQPRLYAILFGVFAALALVLAAVGIYGVISFWVAQRTREIGVRMALGARPRDVLRQVIGHSMGLTLAGIGLGIGAAFGLTRLMSELLFNVSPTDPPTFAAVALLLAGVAFMASYFPARRATRVDPMVVLRSE